VTDLGLKPKSPEQRKAEQGQEHKMQIAPGFLVPDA